MTFRTTINSKENPKKFLQRGFKSMFSNYGGKASPTSPAKTEQPDPRETK